MKFYVKRDLYADLDKTIEEYARQERAYKRRVKLRKQREAQNELPSEDKVG